jgi:hypothetical protein
MYHNVGPASKPQRMQIYLVELLQYHKPSNSRGPIWYIRDRTDRTIYQG